MSGDKGEKHESALVEKVQELAGQMTLMRMYLIRSGQMGEFQEFMNEMSAGLPKQ